MLLVVRGRQWHHAQSKSFTFRFICRVKTWKKKRDENLYIKQSLSVYRRRECKLADVQLTLIEFTHANITVALQWPHNEAELSSNDLR